MEEEIGSDDEKESSHKSRMSDKRTPGERKPNNFLRFEILVGPEVEVQMWIFRHAGDYRLKTKGCVTDVLARVGAYGRIGKR